MNNYPTPQKAEYAADLEKAAWECPVCGIQKPRIYTMKDGVYYSKRECACQALKQKTRSTRSFNADRIYSWLGSRWDETTLRKKTFESFQADKQPRADRKSVV